MNGLGPEMQIRVVLSCVIAFPTPLYHLSVGKWKRKLLPCLWTGDEFLCFIFISLCSISLQSNPGKTAKSLPQIYVCIKDFNVILPRRIRIEKSNFYRYPSSLPLILCSFRAVVVAHGSNFAFISIQIKMQKIKNHDSELTENHNVFALCWIYLETEASS
jgi:hypothetical protein